MLRYGHIHKPVSLPPARAGIFPTAGWVITRAEACNVFNLSAALFALYNLDEAFSTSPATSDVQRDALKAGAPFLFFLSFFFSRVTKNTATGRELI